MDEEDDFNKQQIEDRELLMKSHEPRYSGFYPRPAQKLATKRTPRTMLNVECNHVLRQYPTQCAHGQPNLQYRLWLEASKHDPPFPDRPDSSYNSNIWRNFSKQYGFHLTSDGQKIDEMIASMYPLNIPAPSQIGKYNYARFLTENSLINNEKMKKIAIEQTTRDILDFKQMRLRTDSRNPPLDEQGNIMPPVNYKNYAPRFEAPVTTSTEDKPPPIPGPTRIDIFGREVPKSKPRAPYLWKLSYKLNNPEYSKVQKELTDKSMKPKAYPAPTTSMKVK